jgi:cell division protein FtsN
MATSTDQKPRTGAGSEFDEAGRGSLRPEINVNQSNRGSNSTIAYIIAAVVLVVGAYLLYTNTWSTTTVVPTVTQNNTTLPAPAPDAVAPVTPVPVAPPAADTTTPPATGTAPQPPVAPAQ